MNSLNFTDFWFVGPEIVLVVMGLVVLLAGSIGKNQEKRDLPIAWLSLISLVVTAFYTSWVWRELAGGVRNLVLADSFVIDGFSFVFKIIILVATVLTVLLSQRFVSDGRYRAGEYYSLLLFAATGMMFMVSGYSMLTIWISLELMAMSSYILAGYFKREAKSNEAAMKYFVLGALSSGVMLYGMSLLYGATGTVQLDAMSAALSGGSGNLALIGTLMLVAGLLFKVAAVPFHVWTPDVYEGAPTPVTAFLATASKVASFAILLRILYQGLPALVEDWQAVLAGVAIATMVWGNIAALVQENVKRMLAYSSIAHAGYILMGLLSVNEEGMWSVIYYLLAYSFITIGTFGIVIMLERKQYAGETFADYSGLARKFPGLAAMMLVFMLALTGIPPTGGFFGKFWLFSAAVEAGFVKVAIVGVLMSAVSAYYYLKVIVYMYLKEADDEHSTEPMREPTLAGAVIFCCVLTLLLGTYIGPFVDFVKTGLLPLP